MAKLEISLFLISVAVGVIMWLLPKSLLTVIGSLLIIFSLLVYPVWNLPWIEKSLWLRIAALLLLASMLCVLGYISLPQKESVPNFTADFDIFGAAPDPNNAENSIVAIKATITNTGVPSIVNNIAISVTVDDQQVNGQPIPIPSELKLKTDEGNVITYKGEDFLRLKGMKQPIPTNGGIPGLDVFFFPNISKQNALKAGTGFIFTFQDVLGKEYIFKKTMTGKRVPLLNLGTSKEPVGKIPSEKKDTSVLDLITRYPVINEVIKGEKSCRDLAPEAQIVCVKENARIRFAAMVLAQPGLTAEQRTRILQQTTLADMKRIYETFTLNAVASISSKSYVMYVPPEVAAVYVFLQKPESLGEGSSEFIGNISRDEFLKNWSQYVNIAKNKRMKLIIKASTEDQKQWLQNQIKYDEKTLVKTTFRDPSTNKISEGVEWPLN